MTTPGSPASGTSARAFCVALLQLDVRDGDPRENVARAAELLRTAPEADLYVLPELWTTGYAHATWPDAADQEAAATRAAMRRWAEARGAWVAGSHVERRGDGALVNRLRVVGPHGEDVRYDKAHLFAPMAEPLHLAAGDRRVTVAIDGVQAALSICFDLRFPEQYRHDAAAGAELFLVASAWPRARAEALRLFARARAAENQAFLVLCNRTGAGDDGTRFAGGSCVIAPDGAIVADAGDREGVVFAELDVAAVARARRDFPVLPLRVPGVDTLEPAPPARAAAARVESPVRVPFPTPCADDLAAPPPA
jgi:predicted amidohydrolase